eukprot:scaffold796_cov23-Tisochrysis_lutea.AAC.2
MAAPSGSEGKEAEGMTAPHGSPKAGDPGGMAARSLRAPCHNRAEFWRRSFSCPSAAIEAEEKRIGGC